MSDFEAVRDELEAMREALENLLTYDAVDENDDLSAIIRTALDKGEKP